MEAGIEVEGRKKRVVVVVPAAAGLLTGSPALEGMAKKGAVVFDLLCGMLLFESPCAAITGAGVSVIVGTDSDLVASSGTDMLAGILADLGGGI